MAQPIVIDNWQTGIANSPHLGFADMRNVVINREDGIVEIGWKTEKVSGTVIVDDIKWIIQNEASPANFYAIDDDGNVYNSSNSGDSWSLLSNRTGFGEGAVVWKDYLLITNNTALEAYGPLSGSANWYTIGSFTSGDSLFHPMKVGQDDIVYIGDGRYVATLQENSGQDFAAGTTATYTVNFNALDLPEDYKIKCLEELGTNLMIGTWKGSNPTQVKSAKIFPWDRISDSFNLPISLNENGINQMLTIGNVLYFQAGIEGKIYATNGSEVKEIKQIPKFITGLTGAKWIDCDPGGIINQGGKLMFSISSPGSSGQEITDGVGVWSIDLKTGALIFENQISTGSTGGAAPNDIQIKAIKSVDRNSYLIGWTDGSTFGIDKISNTKRYTNYAARIDSQYFTAGTNTKPAVFSELEFELSEPLTTGTGLKFYYRTDLSAPFTLIGTSEFATDGAIQSGTHTKQIETKSGIQIRIEMTTGESSSNTPKLKRVILT